MTKQWLIDNRSFTKWLCLYMYIAFSTAHSGGRVHLLHVPAGFKTLRDMADNAFEWAREHGLLRVSAIHKCEEADIPYDDVWSRTSETGQRVEYTARTEMEAPCYNNIWLAEKYDLLEKHLPFTP